jgi:hypothetical protein
LIYNLTCFSVKLKLKICFLKCYFCNSENFYMVFFFSKKWENMANGAILQNFSFFFFKFWLTIKYFLSHAFLMTISNSYLKRCREYTCHVWKDLNVILKITSWKKWDSMSHNSMYLKLTLSSSEWYQKIGKLIYNLLCQPVKLKFKFRYLKLYFGKSEFFYMVKIFSKKVEKCGRYLPVDCKFLLFLKFW